jgi:hypothetical protein
MKADRRTSRVRWLVALALSAALLAGVPGTSAVSPSEPQIAGTQLAPDDVLLRIDVAADGSAAWTVEYRIRLDDANTTTAFESIQSDVQTNESSFVGPFEERMRATAATASNATGRDMAIRNVTVRTSRQRIPEEYGIVTYQFRWEGFAATSGDELRVGDAIAGLFLDDSTTIVVGWPEAYRVASVRPDPDDRQPTAVTWNGPEDFTAEEPSVVLTTAPGGTETGGTGTAPPADGDGGNAGLVVGIALALLLGGAAALFYVRRGDDRPPAAGGEAAPETPSASGDDGGDAATPPDELLSNEERVLRLVRDRGGRMKQQEVAETLDWTDAKTSQVVRKMRDEGDLEAFRLGRENVLRLPEEDDGED